MSHARSRLLAVVVSPSACSDGCAWETHDSAAERDPGGRVYGRFAGGLDGPLRERFSEPFANYLDLKATSHFYGESAYRARVAELYPRVLSPPALPRPDQATTVDVSADAYRYGYAPLRLGSLKRHIGEQQMRALLHALLTAEPVNEFETPGRLRLLTTVL